MERALQESHFEFRGGAQEPPRTNPRRRMETATTTGEPRSPWTIPAIPSARSPTAAPDTGPTARLHRPHRRGARRPPEGGRRPDRRPARHPVPRRRLDRAAGGPSRSRQPSQRLHPLPPGAHRADADHPALHGAPLGRAARRAQRAGRGVARAARGPAPPLGPAAPEPGRRGLEPRGTCTPSTAASGRWTRCWRCTPGTASTTSPTSPAFATAWAGADPTSNREDRSHLDPGSRRQIGDHLSSRSPPGLLQRLHDVCLVCPPPKPGGQALVDRGAGELGHRAVRVPAPGAGQPDRVHRCSLWPAQDAPGGHYPGGVRPVRGALHAAAVKLDYLWAALCLVGAVYFVFRSPA